MQGERDLTELKERRSEFGKAEMAGICEAQYPEQRKLQKEKLAEICLRILSESVASILMHMHNMKLNKAG